jgi:hypothetical protein
MKEFAFKNFHNIAIVEDGTEKARCLKRRF